MIVAVDAAFVVDELLRAVSGHVPLLLLANRSPAISLVAPGLLWSETTSALHALHARGLVDGQRVLAARNAFARLPIQAMAPSETLDRAWDIADRMGWQKTHDAEYCAVAERHGCQLVTADPRLVRAAEGRLDYVVDPDGRIQG